MARQFESYLRVDFSAEAHLDEQMEKLSISSAEKSAWAMNDVMVPAYMVAMVSEIDARPLENLRKLVKDSHGRSPTYTAIIMKAAALILKNNPAANRAIIGLPFFKNLVQFKNIDISVAVEKNLPSWECFCTADFEYFT